MDNQTKKQHTVPKCFLKNFSDNGHSIQKRRKKQMTSAELNSELNKQVALKTATTMEDFYTLNTGNVPMLVETLIYAHEIENRYPKIYDMLINPNVTGFTPMDRNWILICLLSLHCRTAKQFKIFESLLPDDVNKHDILEEYKIQHLVHILPRFIEAHQFKRIVILKLIDGSEFFTSDNPVLIIGQKNGSDILKNHIFSEQFNSENSIAIPIDKKHCVLLTQVRDKNGLKAEDYNVFYNKIERVDATAGKAFTTNCFMLESADKYYYGSQRYLKAFFSLINLTE